ncbi:DUF5979 domain-containing protein [Mobiluncus mulieris]|uniref:DUF5979 domain-containing protein n=1 Tax=Mobiluncus mulieris TaxID=2052 RepID=UPI0021E293B7|nr:DUF5979 domain-containing protein [Mobiluncus mulieris]MCV0008374.1 hypothetical protein [Mobiluncus mulieris]
MKESWLTKRLAAFVLAPCVALAGFAIALPATFFPAAEKANATDRAATDHSGPIGTDNDPWPQSFPRDTSLHHESKLKSGRIALVFDFDARYTWESMGGYNFEQRNQIKQYLQNLKGAPVQVGIYTFDRFDRPDNDYPNVAWGNTPDLPATSLDNKEGFDKVMKKLDSLDATGGTKRRKPDATDNFSNQEQGLQKVINDMKKYRYTDVFLFTTGVPNRCGVKDVGCDPDAMIDQAKRDPDKKKFLEDSGVVNVKDWDKYTFDRKGVVAAALKSYELQKGTPEWPGAKLRLMHMNFYYGVNPKECPNDREKRLIEYAGYMLGKKITYTTSQGCQITFNNVNFDNGETLTDRWIAIRHSGHLNRWDTDRDWINKHPNKKVIIDACNKWHGIGVKTLTRWDGIFQDEVKLGGGDGNQMCNHVRDGKFGQTIVKWLRKTRGLAVIKDVVDQDLRYIKPNAGRTIQIVRNNDSATYNYLAGSDGMVDEDTSTGYPVAKVVVPETSGKSAGHKQTATEILTPFKGTDNQLHTGRCVGWSVGEKPELFYPLNYSLDEWGYTGFRFSNEQQAKYNLIKCAMYSRPLQEVQIVKRATTAKDDPIATVLGGTIEKPDGGASYAFGWKCTDPLGLNPQEVISEGSPDNKGNILTIKGKVNNVYDWNPIGIGREVTVPAASGGNPTAKSMLPVGSRCEITEKISLPSGYYPNEPEKTRAKANQLFTSENRVTGRNYKIEIPTNASEEVKKDPELVGQKKTEDTSKGDSQAAESHTFGATINYQAGSTSESGVSPVSQLVSITTYKSKKAGIKFTLELTNSDGDQAFNTLKEEELNGRREKTLPVYYNCRFMPDSKKPLELPETNQGYIPTPVQSGWIYVPVTTDKTTNRTTGVAYLGYQGVNLKDGTLPKQDGHDLMIPTWPVGTHCLFDTVASAETGQSESKPLQLPGFSSENSYKSTLCGADNGSLNQCGNKFFWVGSNKNHEIHLTQNFKRLYGKLQVTKLLQGAAEKEFDAKSQGVGHGYRMVLACKQSGVPVPLEGNKNPGMTVWQGKPVTVGGVPAQADCTITEDLSKTKIKNVEIHAPKPQTVKITDLAQANRVMVTNALSYKKRTLRIQYNTGFDRNMTDDLKSLINNREKTLTVNCTDMDGREVKFSGGSSLTVSGASGTANVSNVPAGSKCTVSADTTGFSVTLGGGKTYTIQVESTPVEVSIPDSDEANATVQAQFSTSPAGKISIASAVKQWPVYNSVKSTLDNKKLHAVITCGTKKYWESDLNLDNKLLTVTPAASATAKIPENTPCNLEVNIDEWPEQVEVTTAMRGVNSGTQSGSKWTTGKSLSFPFTSPGSTTSTTLTLEHRFTEEMTPATLTLNEPSMWTSADPGETDANKRFPVPVSWKNALVEANSGISANVRCEFGSDTFSSPLRFDKSTKSITTQVPKGWNCGFTVDRDALGISGTTLRQVTWQVGSGNHATTTEGYEYSTTGDQGSPNLPSASSPSTPSVSGEASAPKKSVNISWKSQNGFQAFLDRDYRMQLASFNVKKKVGGEGVGAIPAEFQFQIHYSCTLNGKPIPLPQPAAINTQQFPTTVANGTEAWDAQTALKKTLKDRLQTIGSTAPMSQSISIVRFQQGEWHPIDALPAGAVCTLYEDSKATVDSSRLDNYWTHTGGYRGREKEFTCQESSQECSLSGTTADGMNQVKIALSTDVRPRKNADYEAKNNATTKNGVPLNPHVPETLPENFSGTVVPWNNYTFNKAKNLQLTMKVKGTGKELVAGKTLQARLYCKPPAMRKQDGTLAETQSMKGRNPVNISLDFKVEKPNSESAGASPNASGKAQIQNTSTDQEYVLTATSGLRLPVNYKCVIAQKNFPLGDGVLNTVITPGTDSVTMAKTTFATVNPPVSGSNIATEEQLKEFYTTMGGADLNSPYVREYEDDGYYKDSQAEGNKPQKTVDPNVFQGMDENFIAGFQMPAQLAEDKTVSFTLTNTVQRQGVNLTASHKLIDAVSGYYNFGQLNPSGYKLAYKCEDKYLRQVKDKDKPQIYEGEIALANGASAVPVFTADDTNTAVAFVPATSSCQFRLKNAGADPLADNTAIQLVTTVKAEHDIKFDDRFNNGKRAPGKTPEALEIGNLVVDNEGDPRNPVLFEKNPNSNPNSPGSQSAGTGGGSTGSTSGSNTAPLQAQLNFETWYFTGQQKYSVMTYAYGTQHDTAIPADTSFGYNYKCTPPKGFPAATFGELNGNFSQTLNQQESLGRNNTDNIKVVPEGTICQVNGTWKDSQLPYLKVVTSRVKNTPEMWKKVPGSDQLQPDFSMSGLEWNLIAHKEKPNFSVTLDKDNPDGVIVHTVYRNGAEVYVRRVDKPATSSTVNTVTGAKFDLCIADQNSCLKSDSNSILASASWLKFEPVPGNSGVYKATLAPGTYWLGTTDTGKGNQTELLWQRYKFEVKVTKDNACTNTDTFVELAPETKHSGLVDLQQRQLENTPTTGTGTTTPASGTGAGTNPATPGSPSTNPASPSTPTTPSSGTTSGIAAPPEPQCLVNAALGFTKWDVDVADIRFGDLPLTGGRMLWLLGAAGTMLAGAVALMVRNRRRDVNNA